MLLSEKGHDNKRVRAHAVKVWGAVRERSNVKRWGTGSRAALRWMDLDTQKKGITRYLAALGCRRRGGRVREGLGNILDSGERVAVEIEKWRGSCSSMHGHG